MKLKDYLHSERLSPTEFSRRLKCSHSTVIRWILNVTKPSPQAVAAIFEATDGAVTASDLYDQENKAA